MKTIKRTTVKSNSIFTIMIKENLSYRQLYNKGEKGFIDDIEYVSE